MIDPNKVVQPVGFAPVGFGRDKMGLYRFKDGEVYIVRLHAQSDEWQTMQVASAEQRKLIPAKNGDK